MVTVRSSIRFFNRPPILCCIETCDLHTSNRHSTSESSTVVDGQGRKAHTFFLRLDYRTAWPRRGSSAYPFDSVVDKSFRT